VVVLNIDRILRIIPWVLVALVAPTALTSFLEDDAQSTSLPWEDDWESQPGVGLERIAIGLELPTAIAVAEDLDSRSYLVAELRGTIQTITNEGEVSEFATVPKLIPDSEFPKPIGQAGLAGICLDQEAGFVFATYLRRDDEGILRNSVHRFDLGQAGVSGGPVSQLDISGPLADFPSAISHQIGGCETVDGLIYVSVGDGWDFSASRDPDALLGKVLRMTYGGGPAIDNPLAEDLSLNRSYVWAYGFRNPFGIDAVGGDIFVSNNGSDLDTLIKVRAGGDYLWDGTDESVASNALYVWVPSVSPVHLEYADSSASALPPEWRQGFFVAIAGNEGSGVQFVPYDIDSNQVTGVPRWVVKSSGGPDQAVSGIALDSDGLVFAALLPDSDGETALYRVTFGEQGQLPNRIESATETDSLLAEFGCLACHRYQGQGRGVGPPLDQRALKRRLRGVLFSEAYEDSLLEIDLVTDAPQIEFDDAREEVLASRGDDRLLKWVKYRIMEPRFDRHQAQMPTLGIDEADAEALADALINPEPWWRQQIEMVGESLFVTRQRAIGFGWGVGLTVLAFTLLWAVLRWFRYRRANGQPR